MQTKKINPIALSVLAGLTFLVFACRDDGFDIPQASTQADFDYLVEVFIDEDTGQESFGVQLTNKSIQAQSYQWDFGNGETSTEENPYVLFTSSGQFTIKLEVTAPTQLYYNNLSKSVTLTLGKQVIYAEDFMGGVPDNEEYWLPEGWQAIDNDGDGFNWYFGVRNGLGQMRSQSYDSSEDAALNPDNWLMLPEVDLSSVSEGAVVTFRYTVGVTATTPRYRKEHYGIFVSAGSDALENFSLLFEETFTEDTPQWTALERTVDLSEYAGQNVYIAIRHYGVTDMDRMFVEEIEVFKIE
ncbi:MAG: choice-of-anchor J domain-containing protein [Bacteroidales bacterium]|nr:choice-of-anchor J domain-containing protein [Bacteroidales bacterium]